MVSFDFRFSNELQTRFFQNEAMDEEGGRTKTETPNIVFAPNKPGRLAGLTPRFNGVASQLSNYLVLVDYCPICHVQHSIDNRKIGQRE